MGRSAGRRVRSALNNIQPSQADSKQPQEGFFGDKFRKAPKGHWRKACGSPYVPALAKVRQIIESLFLGFHFIGCTREDGGGWRGAVVGGPCSSR